MWLTFPASLKLIGSKKTAFRIFKFSQLTTTPKCAFCPCEYSLQFGTHLSLRMTSNDAIWKYKNEIKFRIPQWKPHPPKCGKDELPTLRSKYTIGFKRLKIIFQISSFAARRVVWFEISDTDKFDELYGEHHTTCVCAEENLTTESLSTVCSQLTTSYIQNNFAFGSAAVGYDFSMSLVCSFQWKLQSNDRT